MAARKTRVLILERQAAMHARVLAYFAARPDVEALDAAAVGGAFPYAADVEELRALLRGLGPDAIVLGLRDPAGSELGFAAKLREAAPAPVIALAAGEINGARVGCVSFFDAVRRPAEGDEAALQAALRMLVYAVRRAVSPPKPPERQAEDGAAALRADGGADLIALGASAGGTEALLAIASALPGNMPPIVAVQHIARGFAEVFASHLDAHSPLTAVVARDGDVARDGRLYLAPDARQLTVAAGPRGYVLHCREPLRGEARAPSVDALFSSVAQAAGPRAVGVILTGMGKDGAEGLKRMRDAGARTIGQDEGSSAIYGMPKAAWELGAVEKRLALEQIAPELARAARPAR